jgi:hypothetical protein
MVHIAAAAIRRAESERSLGRAAQLRIFERIAKPPYRLDHACVQLLAQPPDEDLDRVRVAVEILIVEMLPSSVRDTTLPR